jgi:hypothetical protein
MLFVKVVPLVENTKLLSIYVVLSKAWVCGCLPAEIVGSNTTVGMCVYLLGVLYVVR